MTKNDSPEAGEDPYWSEELLAVLVVALGDEGHARETQEGIIRQAREDTFRGRRLFLGTASLGCPGRFFGGPVTRYEGATGCRAFLPCLAGCQGLFIEKSTPGRPMAMIAEGRRDFLIRTSHHAEPSV